MSTCFYTFPVSEVYLDDKDNEIKYWDKNLPHWKAIGAYLASELNKMHIEQFFYGKLKNKIKSCYAQYALLSNGTGCICLAIEAVPRFYLTKKNYDLICNQLDAQLSDGWGESYDRECVPNVSDRYRIAL